MPMDPTLKALLARHKFLRELRGGSPTEVADRALELQRLTQEINLLMAQARTAEAEPPNRRHRRAMAKKALRESRKAPPRVPRPIKAPNILDHPNATVGLPPDEKP